MVVIVDDDRDDLDVYCDLFLAIDPDIEVKTFISAPEALEYLKLVQYLPELVILDLNMPKMTGLDLLRHIRKDPTLSGLYVAMITTACTDEDAKTALALGAQCLPKQARFEDFKTILKRLLKELKTSMF